MTLAFSHRRYFKPRRGDVLTRHAECGLLGARDAANKVDEKTGLEIIDALGVVGWRNGHKRFLRAPTPRDASRPTRPTSTDPLENHRHRHKKTFDSIARREVMRLFESPYAVRRRAQRSL